MRKIKQVSVIMPVYNETLSELKASITSIQKQSFKNFEYIIIDDNPNSFQIKEYLLKKSNQDSRIKVFFHKKNIGAINSNNEAALRSSGLFIARMDADDIADHHRLEDQLNFSLKYNLDISSCNFISFNNNNVSKEPSYCNKTQINQSRLRRVMSFVNVAIGPTLFFKKSSFIKSGKYRHVLTDDYDLVARFLINKFKMGYLAKPLVYKRTRKNSMSSKNALHVYVTRMSISKYLRKYRFKKLMPLTYLNKNLQKINKRDIICYSNFMKNSFKYSNTGSLMNLFEKYFYTFSSYLVFKNNFMIHFNKFIQNLLIS